MMKSLFTSSFYISPLYMSPQILQALPYSSKCDIWSLGIIYYEMLFQNTPWPCCNQIDLLDQINKTPLKFPYQSEISQDSQNFIIGCLQVEEEKRFSWDQVYEHKLFKNEEKEQNQVQEKEQNQVEKKQISEKCVQIIKEIQKFLEEKNLELDFVFQKLDASADGELDIQELSKFLTLLQPDLTAPDIQEIFSNFADKNTQSVNYQQLEKLLKQYTFDPIPAQNEMLDLQRAEILLKQLIDKIIDNNINIERLFKTIDLSGDNKLDLQELTALLLKIDDSLTPDEAKYIFAKFDKEKKQEITFSQFKEIIYGNVEEQGGDPYEKEVYGNIPSQIPVQTQEVIKLLKKIIKQHNLDIRIIFQNFDFDQSQSLSQQEFSSFLKVLNAQLTNEDIQIIFEAFDQNHNNLIDISDIEIMLSK